MTITDWLAELGGVARRSELLRLVDRRDLEAALDGGDVLRDSRGLYHLPTADDGLRVARRLGGVLTLTSAALHHGWAVKTVPDKPHILVPRGRRVSDRSCAHLHWGTIRDEDRDGHVLTPDATLRACLRNLDFPDGLAVADSALREGFGQQSLARVADGVKGAGAARVRRVAAHASPKVANPFESALHAITLDVPGLAVEPQLTISDGPFTARPDFVDERLHVVLEADSFTWHGDRGALASDTRRYNAIVIRGWLLLRFCYEDVMFHPDEVRDTLIAVVALAELHHEVLSAFAAARRVA